MPNLLPTSNKKRIREEYILRLVVVFLVFLLVILVIASIFSLPSYFLSKNKAALADEKLDFLSAFVEVRQKSGLSEKILTTNEQVRILSLPEFSKISDSIDFILDKKTGSIALTNLVLRSNQSEEGLERSLFVGGTARTRTELTNFADALESNPNFSEVILPVSNLARSRDVDFNIEIRFLAE